MYMPTWLLERRCCPVHVMSWPSEERLSPVEAQLSGVVGSLLTSPCFRKGLRTVVVMEHAGCHHYLFTGASQMGSSCISSFIMLDEGEKMGTQRYRRVKKRME